MIAPDLDQDFSSWDTDYVLPSYRISADDYPYLNPTSFRTGPVAVSDPVPVDIFTDFVPTSVSEPVAVASPDQTDFYSTVVTTKWRPTPVAVTQPVDGGNMDFLDSLSDAAGTLAGTLAQAGGVALSQDITGSNYLPALAVQQQQQRAAQQNSSILLWVVVFFLIYKYA